MRRGEGRGGDEVGWGEVRGVEVRRGEGRERQKRW